MVLASEEVHNLFGFNTVTAKPSKQKSWFDTVNAWVQYVFAWMGNKLVKLVLMTLLISNYKA